MSFGASKGLALAAAEVPNPDRSVAGRTGESVLAEHFNRLKGSTSVLRIIESKRARTLATLQVPHLDSVVLGRTRQPIGVDERQTDHVARVTCQRQHTLAILQVPDAHAFVIRGAGEARSSHQLQRAHIVRVAHKRAFALATNEQQLIILKKLKMHYLIEMHSPVCVGQIPHANGFVGRSAGDQLDADHLETELGKAGPGHEAHIARADNGDFHTLSGRGFR